MPCLLAALAVIGIVALRHILVHGLPHLPLRYLDGKEIDRLAEWVWSSFHAGKKIDSTTLYL